MLNDYVSWWREQMADLLGTVLPQRWRLAAAPMRALVLDGAGHVQDVDDARPEPHDAADRPLQLILPPGMLMAREVALPLAVGRDLTGAVGYEMDRLTPFSADELYWSIRPLRRDTERGQIVARLAIVPRARLDPVLAGLGASGLHPHLLSDGHDRIELGIGMLTRARQRRRIAILAGVCAVLAVLALAAPFLRLSHQQAALDVQIAALQPQADAAQRLRSQLARRSTAAAAFAQARQVTGDALAAIAAVTRAMPDDTHLTSLALHQRHLSFDGESGAAARLIGRIADDPALREPSFAAPVTSTGSRDLFSIHATLVPPNGAGAPAPRPASDTGTGP